LEFSDSDDEKEQDPDVPATMEEAQALEAQDKDNGLDMSEDQSVELKSTANMFEGMLHFSDDEDEKYKKKFQLRTCGFTSSIEEAVNADGTDVDAGTGNEGIVGEQELNLSSLTDSDTNRPRLIDDFYALEGLQHFSDGDEEGKPEDKGEVFFEKDKVGANKEETKAMTRDEHKKANIALPPAYKAPHPKDRVARSLSPKIASPRPTKPTSPKQTPKVPLSTQVAHRQATPGQGHKVKIVVATDMLLDSSDPNHKPGTMTASNHPPSPKQTKTITFVSVISTPKAPPKTQQTSPTKQTPTKPAQAKADVKKASPIKEKQSPTKTPNRSKGKVFSKPKQVTLSQKLADVDKQIAIKARQADKSNSPTMKKPFDEVTKPSKTTERIVETSDGKGYQLLSEKEKKKADREKTFDELGLLYF